jgi:hypothetical protein
LVYVVVPLRSNGFLTDKKARRKVDQESSLTVKENTEKPIATLENAKFTK